MSTQALATDRRVGGSNLLWFALRLDAAVSSVFGVVLVVAVPLASEALGISTTALLAVGLVCLAYAAALVRIQSRPLGPGAGWLVVADRHGHGSRARSSDRRRCSGRAAVHRRAASGHVAQTIGVFLESCHRTTTRLV